VPHFQKFAGLTYRTIVLLALTLGFAACARRADLARLMQYAQSGDEEGVRVELAKGFEAAHLNSLDGQLESTPLHVAAEK
jgi:hypothetical protein